MSERYHLRIVVEIEKRDEHGHWSGERLTTRRDLIIELDGFREVADVLGRFDELGQAIKADQAALHAEVGRD